MIDRTFRPLRLFHDLTKGAAIGSILFFLLHVVEGKPVIGSTKATLLLLAAYGIITIALFERYLPPVKDFENTSTEENQNG